MTDGAHGWKNLESKPPSDGWYAFRPPMRVLFVRTDGFEGRDTWASTTPAGKGWRWDELVGSGIEIYGPLEIPS